MHPKFATALCAAMLSLSLVPCSATAKDTSGSKDHPLVKRFEGSGILFYKQESYGALKIALEPIVFNYNDQKYNPYKSLAVEGRKTTIYYLIPAGVGTLEVARNYEAEFKDKGFEILYSASGDQIERNRGDNLAAQIYGTTPDNTNQQHPDMQSLTSADLTKTFYLAAKLARPEGDVYATVVALEAAWTAAGAFKIPEHSTLVRLDVVEVKPMQQRMVTVSSDEMSNQITSSGRVALYGIYFDFNKADVKSESSPTLEQIAKLLADHPGLKLLVVGHTDGIGSFESNRTLSQRRAESVVAELVSKSSIDPKRLFPVGVSFASPVASNATEDGRAKNRRVELVEIVGKGE